MPNPIRIPRPFVLRLGHLVLELHEPPNADYVPLKSNAQRMFQCLRKHHVLYEDEAKTLLQSDREAAQDLLYGCIDFSNNHGEPLSLQNIADAKPEDTKWDRTGVTSAPIAFFLMRVIEEMA